MLAYVSVTVYYYYYDSDLICHDIKLNFCLQLIPKEVIRNISVECWLFVDASEKILLTVAISVALKFEVAKIEYTKYRGDALEHFSILTE